MKIIGLTGPIGAGKSTIAKALCEYYQDCTILPFAKSLKDFAKQLGWNGKKDDKGRKILQLLGTDIGRDLINENIWVNKWNYEQATEFVIADDVRFQNEVDIIERNKGIIVMVYGRIGNITNESLHKSENINLKIDHGTLFDNSSDDLNASLPKLTSTLDLFLNV